MTHTPSIFHSQVGVLEGVLLLSLVKLEFNNVTVRLSPTVFQALAEGNEAIGLIQSLLGSGVLALNNGEAVIVFATVSSTAWSAKAPRWPSRVRTQCSSVQEWSIKT
jgi:hypothetical protein